MTAAGPGQRQLARIAEWLQAQWYPSAAGGRSARAALLRPFGVCYAAVMRARRALYRAGVLPRESLAVPVIVIGNVTVGGTGKTPLTAAVVGYLRSWGYRPGVVCRGYRGRSAHWPRIVDAASDPALVGDEAVLLRRRCQCPVAAGPKRAAAGRLLVEAQGCDVIVSDDGLQHLALERDVEIAVVDAARGHGNGRCLPAGPLREPIERLRTVDIVIEHLETELPSGDVPEPALPDNGSDSASGSARHRMWLCPGDVEPLDATGSPRRLGEFKNRAVHGVCGIGNPERFFRMLERHGIDVRRHAFGDHHRYEPADLEFDERLPALCTEKDAVKIRALLEARQLVDEASARWWSVHVQPRLDAGFARTLERVVARAWSSRDNAAFVAPALAGCSGNGYARTPCAGVERRIVRQQSRGSRAVA